MHRLYLTICLLLSFALNVQAQEIRLGPYLQDVQPNSIKVLWESDTAGAGMVEFGLDETLGQTVLSTFILNNGNYVHEVELTGLERFTTYFYRVKMVDTVSDIFQFKTPPFASDEQSIRLVAMSDMQRDGSEPDKFEEMVNDGVFDFFQEQYPDTLIDELNLVLIPGDLVVTGNNYDSWRTQFFEPSTPLFSQVPLYPVLGNHENNTQYYFNYFSLPQNGTPGYEEHWWYTDYSNVRLVGLNSNGAFANDEQLLWLEDVLNQACDIDSIDFVFAELHHPHLSELWTPGESNFTGEVIELLENFTEECGKPSIHFFGHTHGYSRGQSRDHKHLWVNVATAGGAIDNWGEFPNADYDEFTVSQDEYGFVVMDIEAGDDPNFRLQRISRGNQYIERDNELRDEIRVYRYAPTVEAPLPVFPLNETVNPDCVLLEGSTFASNINEAEHGASHWQLALDCDFSNPVYDSWKQHENWYYDIDTQADDLLTDEEVTGLLELSDYCWRVRYRDQELNWSEWSDPAPFETGESELSPNLLVNEGAESLTFGWLELDGPLEALTSGECNGISPNTGDLYFAVGGVCDDGPFGESQQLVALNAFEAQIEAGEVQANFGGYLSNYSGSDRPELYLIFLDEDGMPLDTTDLYGTNNSNWTLIEDWQDIPTECKIIDFRIRGTRFAGSDNDSYFDDLFLRLGKSEVDCSQNVVGSTSPSTAVPALGIFPNPANDQFVVDLVFDGHGELLIQDIMGRMVLQQQVEGPQKARVDCRDFPVGLYVISYIKNGQVMASSKLVRK